MKSNSILTMLTALILSFSFVACSSSNGNDEDDPFDSPKGQKTLKIDDESLYAVGCSAEQTKGNGMYLHIRAATDPEFATMGHELTVHIAPSKVSQLNEGDVFDVDDLSVQEFRRFNEIVFNTYQWNVLEGNITIKRITSMEMTIQINGLLLQHKSTGVERIISGTATLDSGVWDSNGKTLSFEEASNL
jgi:hypothetical protein